MTEGLPDRPANIHPIVAINQGRLPLTMEEPEAQPLQSSEVRDLMVSDPKVRLLDMREPEDFGRGHVAGAVNIPLSAGEFEQRIGWVLEPETPLILLGEQDRDAREAIHKMGFLGLDRHVRGFVAGGQEAWKEAGLAGKELPQISVEDLHRYISENGINGFQVVDVREDEEWDNGHIEGAFHMNFKKMGKNDLELPFSKNDTLAIICGGGIRSSTGASLLLRHGYQEVKNVAGGMNAWRAAGFKTVPD